MKRCKAMCRWLVFLFAIARGALFSADKFIADYGGHAEFQSAVWGARILKFDKYGIDAEVIMITGGARSVAALHGGSTQIATGSATEPLAATPKVRKSKFSLPPTQISFPIDDRGEGEYLVLADTGDMSANFPRSRLNVKGTYLRENRDLVKRFVRAYAEAIHAIKTQRDRTIKVFANRIRIDDAETVKTTYDYFVPRFSPRISMDGVGDTLSFYAKQNADFKSRRAEEFVDPSIMDELE